MLRNRWPLYRRREVSALQTPRAENLLFASAVLLAAAMETVEEDEEQQLSRSHFFSQENGVNLMDDLLAKIHTRSRAYFVIQGNDYAGHEIFIINGDQTFKTIFGYEQFDGLTLQHLSGPATSSETLRKIYSNLFMREPCEHYLNLYTASGAAFLLSSLTHSSSSQVFQ
jgi:hypothetical protein